MNEMDDILRAEKTIHEVAEELKKMKNAAQLMDGAQEKVDAVIKSSDEIIVKIEEFVRKSSEILQLLGDYDIQKDLSELKEHGQSLSSDLEWVKNNIEENGGKLTTINEKLQTITEQLQSVNEILTAHQKKLNLIEEYAQSSDEKFNTYSNWSSEKINSIESRQTIFFIIIIVALLAIIGILVFV